MLKDFFLSEVKNGIAAAIKQNQLGAMTENDKFQIIKSRTASLNHLSD